MTIQTGRYNAWPFARFGGLGAIGFAALIVGANLVLEPAGMPVIGADIEEVNTFFAAESGAVGLSSSVTPAAWLCVIVFGAAAVATIWPRERAAGTAWSLVGFAGLLLQTAAFVGVVAIRLALSATTERSGTATLWALHNALFVLNGVFLTVALLGLSLGGRRAGLIRRWHAAVGLVAAAGLFVSATLTPLVIDHAGPLALISLISWLLWVVWLVTYGVTLLRLVPATQPSVG